MGKLLGFIIGWNIGRTPWDKERDRQLYNSTPARVIRYTIWIATVIFVSQLFS